VILTDGFYEFTTPGDPKAKKKQRWLFTWPRHAWFGIAGIYRTDAAVGEAFTMLTCPPGPDIAPYHNRQVVLLSPQDCFDWLSPTSAAGDFLKPLPEGSLAVTSS
jgi:putative SOS response-associated peptidase YedK